MLWTCDTGLEVSGPKSGKMSQRTGLSGLRYFKPNDGDFDRGGGVRNPRSTLNLGSKWDERHSVGHTRHFADFPLDDSYNFVRDGLNKTSFHFDDC